MPDPALPATPAGAGRIVTLDTLAVAPDIASRPLAEPWRRLAGMGVDLLVVTLLSILSGPWLGLGTGLMLVVLFGNARTAPLPLKAVRLGCRVGEAQGEGRSGYSSARQSRNGACGARTFALSSRITNLVNGGSNG